MRWDADADEGGLPEQLRRRVDSNRVRVGVGAVIVLVLLALGGAVLVAGLNSAGSSRTVPVTAVTSSVPDATPTAAALYVHVLGAVASAGLFVLHPGDRVVDAIAAAGGFAADAERGGVNLARPLADGEQIVVPRVGEVAAPGSSAQGAAAPAAAAASGAVSLNSATAAELEELPRIGPAMAERIVAYREENGPFTSVDQLLEVSGIGEKTLEAFRDQVTL